MTNPCPVSRIDVARSRASGSLTIGSVFMHRDAFAVVDTLPLRGASARRGADRLIPYADGLTPKRRRRTVTEVSLQMVIEGRIDVDGDPHSDPIEGLALNIEWLMSNLVEPLESGDGTRGASLTTPGGGPTLTGPVHVENMELGDRNQTGLQLAVLDLSLPRGRLGA